MSFPIPSSPEWCLTEEGFRAVHLPHYESIFALANGYMGVRASLETNPLLGDPGFYVAGVFDRIHGHVHEIVNLPTWIGIGMNVDGFPVDLRKGTLLEYRRTLDMKQGILFTRIVWRDAANHTTRFELAMLVHQTERHLALQWGTVTALDYDATIRFSGVIDAWAVKYASSSGAARLTDISTRDLGADGVLLACATRQTGLGVAIGARLMLEGQEKRQARPGEDRVAEQVEARIHRGQSLSFAKHVVVCTSREEADPGSRTAAILREMSARPLDELLRRHTAAWADRWADTDIRIGGDARAQSALRFNLFHLASLAAPWDDRISLGAKGLHGNGYSGVYFWDTEIYMLPFYTHTCPAAAKALLTYRHHMLEDARLNAQDLQRSGAFYPWNSSINGRGHHWKNWQEHVGSDIAYGIDWYARATGDVDFLHGPGAEIIFETARYWQSRVEPHPERGYVLSGLTGPDEIHRDVANNAFTNYLVKWHLGRAARLAEELQAAGQWEAMAGRLSLNEADLLAWRDISERLYFPFDAERQIHEQFEGYFLLPDKEIDRSLSRMQYTGPVQHSFKPTKVAQQADTVLMYWMFQDAFPAEVRQAGYLYYEPRCSHTSSLSRCIFSAVAAQTGLAGEAYRQFLLSAEADIAPGLEMESESGIHAACMGGTWLAAITGLAGVWLGNDTLRLHPRLPAAWQSMQFPLAWKNLQLEFVITHSLVRVRTRGGETPLHIGPTEITATPRWTTVHLAQPEPVEAVILDLDGVLVDTAEFHYLAWKRLADQLGVPFDREANHALRGVDRWNSLLRLLGDQASRFRRDELEEFCTRKNAHYVELIQNLSPADLLPGAPQFLENLRARRLPAAVASSSKNARFVVDRLGLAPLLSAVVDGSEAAESKPAPDLFLLAASRLGVPPTKCVVVEDAAAGIDAALAAGMRCVGVGVEDVVAGADLFAPSVAEIDLDRLPAEGPAS